MDGENKSMDRIHIGIDNGTTGTIAIINNKSAIYASMPIKKELSYTKKKQYITRIHWKDLGNYLRDNVGKQCSAFCLIERPMVNPMRFKASMSAIRALEATLIVLERLEIPYQYIDSKEWQRALLPS